MWSVLAKRGLREIDAGLESLLLHSFNKKSLHKCFTLKKKNSLNYRDISNKLSF